MGWDNSEKSTRIILLPSTIVALASIAIVLISQIHNARVRSRNPDFDPSNPFHLMAAASAGGMPRAFSGMSDEDIRVAQKIKVKFGNMNGRDALVEVV